MKTTFSISFVCIATCLLSSCGIKSQQDQFAIADTNRDDKLSRKEVSDSVIKVIFSRFDSNKDGKLTYEEWQASDKSATKLLFAERDTNGSGYLTIEEALASADRQKFLAEFMNKADLDRDGKMNRAEAIAYEQKHANSSD